MSNSKETTYIWRDENQGKTEIKGNSTSQDYLFIELNRRNDIERLMQCSTLY
jgi:hypothetical protein